MLDYGAASKPRRVSLNLSQKFILGFLLLSLLLSGGVCLVGYQSIQAKYMDFYYRIALSAAQTAADLIEAETAERYLSSLTEDEDYAGAFHAMDVVKEYTGMQYLYLFYPSEEGYLYIYDARVEGEDPQDLCALGQIDAYPGTNDHLMRAFETGQPVEDILVSDSELGYVGTVFAPVLDAGGRSVALMGADVSMHEVQEELRSFLLKSLGLSVGTVFVLVFLYLVYLKRRVVDQIGKLTQSVNAYAQDSGNLVYSDAQIHTGDEIEQLSNAFTHMAGQVESYMRNLEKVTAEKQRIATELDVATNIQMSVLPRLFPPFPERDDFDIYASIRPAKEVGGDFYDFYLLDQDHLLFTVSDVSGKGVPAALFMMIAKALLKNQALEGKPLGEVVSTASSQLCEGNEASMFVTSLVMLLDLKARTLTCVNAGHNPPLIRRKGGQFAYVSMRRSLPMAAMEGVKYREFTLEFNPGDQIFLYTDGVTEALNPAQELYGEQRLLDALNALEDGEHMPVKRILDSVMEELDRYADGAPQADDITMLALRLRH